MTQQKTGLPPVEGKNYEVGIKGELMDGQLNASLAMFRYIHENRAVTDFTTDIEGPDACGGWYCSTASGKVRSQGIEAELSGEVLPNLQLTSSYTYNTTKFLKDTELEGKIYSTATPMHMLRVWSDYRLPGELTGFVSVRGQCPEQHLEFRARLRAGRVCHLELARGL